MTRVRLTIKLSTTKLNSHYPHTYTTDLYGISDELTYGKVSSKRTSKTTFLLLHSLEQELAGQSTFNQQADGTKISAR